MIDLEDERYSPVFAPLVYSKQKVSASLKFEQWEGNNVFLVPFVKSAQGEILLNPIEIENIWQEISFEIPPTKDGLIEEIGFYIETDSIFVDGNGALGRVLLDNFTVKGPAWYNLDFQFQQLEFDSITPFSHHRGEHWLDKDKLVLVSKEEPSYSLTGNYYTKNLHIVGYCEPLAGYNHQIVFRASGLYRSYSIGFCETGIALYRNDFGEKELAKVVFDWQQAQKYHVDLKVDGKYLVFKIDGKIILTYDRLDDSFGMFGFKVEESKMRIGELMIKASI